MEQTTKYNNDWFKKRALNYIKPLAPNVWDFSDSLLLYISPTGVEGYESLQENNTPYFKLVTEPEKKYLKLIAADIANLLPSNFEYIDLGPGTEHKERFIFDELKKQGKAFTYIPVDISNYYLQHAATHASNQGIPVRPIQCSFEELATTLAESSLPRFVNLGLTFSNYEPGLVLEMLKNMAGKNGYIFINAQIRDRVNMEVIKEIYAKDAVTMADDKIKLIGLDQLTDVTPREADNNIKVWCSIINPSTELKTLGVKAGDKILVFQSLRYTVAQLETELKKTGNKYKIFDTQDPFVGAIITT